ncbi:LOW QUALITY PROTEIN: hypothetical protein OSB04_012774 [Centaurea solstitialis]|uniref:Uncharacterized protein n=1 Tax=Centaurea solstitialis TaxID=347529 RepID=A0AA38TNP2_9ASTR|nr:LOW QUALITY PROTEIN: hypothetical protein OSB04_012774 [Centaurea solstitialis]
MDTQETVLVSKVPMLKPNEFDMWKIRIRQYMLLTDYGMWEVVENGPGTDEEVAEGGARPPPRSDADRKRRQTEMKALSTLLLAIPNEYQHQFSRCTDAKALWTALEKRFSGTKSTKRNQKAILKHQYENFTSLKNESMTQTFDRFNKLIGELATVDVKMDKDDVNRKFLRSLGEEWTIYTVSFRQGDDLEDKELEDLYNDLRIFEAEVEAKKRPIGYSYNTALLSSENPNSFNTTAITNTTASYNNNTTVNENISNKNSCTSQESNDDTILEAFLASHVKSSLINDDLDQINAYDLEEMDIKWQMAMLTLRTKRFIRRTGRNNFDVKRGDKAGFDKSKVRCYKCNEPGHFARECKGGSTNHQNPGASRFNNKGNNPSSSQVLDSQEGQGFDWSDHAEEVVQNQALMAEIRETEIPSESNQGRRSSLGMWIVVALGTRHVSCPYLKTLKGGHVAFGDNPTGGKISGKGKVSKGKMTFDDVYYVEQLRYNLLSVSQVCDKKFGVFFTDTDCLILAPGFKIDESQVMLRTPRKDNVYCLDIEDASSLSSLNCLFSKASVSESSLWHRRMCHMNFKNMNLLVKNNLVRGLPAKEFSCDDHCVACLKGKQHKSSHKSKEVNNISSPLQLLHMDLFGPTNVMSIGKKSYCLVIVDDYSRFTWVYFLRTKDETSALIKPFCAKNGKQDKSKDNDTEFKNADLNSFCEEKGIERQYSAPRTPQQNGVAERRNRTLIEAARTMLADSKLPITFWAEAVNTACYVQNRVLIVKSKGKTPYELFEKKKPYIGFLKPFRCPCTILDTKTHLGKFDSKSDDGFLVGYSFQSKALRVFNNSTRIIEENDNVKCNENTPNIPGNGPNWLFDIDSLTNSLNMSSAVITGSSTEQIQKTSPPFVMFPMPIADSNDFCTTDGVESDKQKEVENVEKNDDQQTEETSISDNIDGIPSPDEEPQWDQEPKVNDSNLGVVLLEEPLHLTRTRKNHPPSLVIGDIQSPMITRKQSKALTDPHSGMISVFFSQTEPKKAHDAMKDPSWIEAMQEELLQFVLQHVWDLVDLPRGHRVIGTKWIFRNKTDERGIVIKNKARLVAKGYTQEEGIDYDDLPESKPSGCFWPLHLTKDSKSTRWMSRVLFLYGTIDEEVYVSQPPGFKDPKYPDTVYKLRKALYGLHQAPRAWYDTLSSYLLVLPTCTSGSLLGIMCRVDKPSDYISNVTRHLRVTPVRTYKSNKLDETPKWRVRIYNSVL